MKKTIIIILNICSTFCSTSQTDAIFSNYRDNSDFLLFSLSLFPDGSYKCTITDMSITDQPMNLFVSKGSYLENKKGTYILTDSYGNKLMVAKEGPIPALVFDKKAPVYLRNKRLFFLGETDPTTRCYASQTTWSYFSKEELREYNNKNRIKYTLSDGSYLSVDDIDFSLTLQNNHYILQAECFRQEPQTLSKGTFRRQKNILVLRDEGGFTFYMLVAEDGVLIKYENGYAKLNKNVYR